MHASTPSLDTNKRAPGNVRAGGFALVIVLWVLAGLTVVAVAVAASARVSAESTKLLRDRVRAEAAFISTAARIQMIVATSEAAPNRYQGARGRLYLDGRTTDVSADEQVVLQDGRGLINLNLVDDQTLIRLLAHCGVSAEAAPALADTLGDYIDADSLKRLNGAEAFEYRSAGSSLGPRNAPLLSREELWRVQGWSAIRAAWDRQGCNKDVLVHGDGRYNQATATLASMRANGLDEGIAQGYIDARGEGLVYDAAGPQSGRPREFSQLLQLGGSVGQTMRVRHSLALVEWMLEYDLELTPSRVGGPWRLHEVRYLAKQPDSKLSKLSSNFPAVEYRPTEQELFQGNAPSRIPFGN